MRARAIHLAALGLALLLAAWPAWADGQPARVDYVVDGDTVTVWLRGKSELVRLIGVDAPETTHSKGLARRARRYERPEQQEAALGAAARQAARGLLVPGEVVRLAWDQQRRDRHGRLLAYLFLPDGRMLNALLISRGWARAFRKFAYRHKKRFLGLEQQARQAQRGLWTQGGP